MSLFHSARTGQREHHPVIPATCVTHRSVTLSGMCRATSRIPDTRASSGAMSASAARSIGPSSMIPSPGFLILAPDTSGHRPGHGLRGENGKGADRRSDVRHC